MSGLVIECEEFAACSMISVYRGYQDDIKNEDCLRDKLPCKIKYDSPRAFRTTVGSAQIKINRILRPWFSPRYKDAYPNLCPSIKEFVSFVEEFVSFVKARQTQHVTFSKEQKLLICCAYAMELNYYFLKKNCYRFAGSMSEILVEILQKEEDFNYFFSEKDAKTEAAAISLFVSEIYSVDLSGENKQVDVSKPYSCLKEYCAGILKAKNSEGFIFYQQFYSEFCSEFCSEFIAERKRDRSSSKSPSPDKMQAMRKSKISKGETYAVNRNYLEASSIETGVKKMSSEMDITLSGETGVVASTSKSEMEKISETSAKESTAQAGLKEMSAQASDWIGDKVKKVLAEISPRKRTAETGQGSKDIEMRTVCRICTLMNCKDFLEPFIEDSKKYL